MDDDDEILGLFLEESAEHLDAIEEDLLSIEEAGADIDIDLVNKVFRAMHTIKGGAGFFGLIKIKDLTHVAESILDQVRNGKLIPDKKIVQNLLTAVDLINEMMNNPETIESIDISEAVANIEAIIKLNSSAKEQIAQITEVHINDHSGNTIFNLKEFDISQCVNSLKGGDHFYLLTYDLFKDIENKNRTPQDVIAELISVCHVIDSKVIFDNIPALEEFTKVVIPFYVFISTVLEPDMVFSCFDLEENNVVIFDPKETCLDHRHKEKGDICIGSQQKLL